jgi:hypothetical protein
MLDPGISGDTLQIELCEPPQISSNAFYVLSPITFALVFPRPSWLSDPSPNRGFRDLATNPTRCLSMPKMDGYHHGIGDWRERVQSRLSCELRRWVYSTAHPCRVCEDLQSRQ